MVQKNFNIEFNCFYIIFHFFADVELMCESQDLEWEFEETCKLKMLGADLSNGKSFSNVGFIFYVVFVIKFYLILDSPIVLYIGEDGKSVWSGLQQTKTRLIYFSTIPTLTSSFYQLVQKAACYVFEYITNRYNMIKLLFSLKDQFFQLVIYLFSNVYIVGHGLGALLVSKLLSNKDFFKNSYTNRLQAVFLISGIYNSVEDCDNKPIDKTFEKEQDLKAIIESMDNTSPLFDDFNHLLKPGVRLYVFSADKDEPQFKVQSRQMFDRFADCCDQSDLHFEIKEKFDRKSLLGEMCKPNCFLGRLIRYDISLSQSR